MRFVKQLPLKEGGSCSECNADYTALNGVKALVEYTESKPHVKGEYRLTEPFNFCKECYDKLQNGELKDD